MRILLRVMSIMMMVATFPAMAASDTLESGFPLLDEIVYERPDPITFKGTIQRLSLGQTAAFVGGGALGAFIGNRLVGYVVGRYANTPDRVGFILMGTMFGAVLGGRWCDEKWWPC